MECIPPIFYNFGISAIFINSVYHKQKIKKVIQKVHKNWTRLSDKSEIEILTQYSDTGLIMDRLYAGILSSALLFFALLSLTPNMLDYVHPLNVSRERTPMYMVEFFVDDEKYYWTILLHAGVVSILGLIPLITIDIFVANCIQHTCGMMKILIKRLENTMKAIPATKKDNDIYDDIKECLILHADILDFFDDVNNVIGTVFGLLLVILISLTSLTGIVVLIKWGEWHQVIRFGMFTMAELFHAFCFSYHSQDLINHNNRLYIAIINSGWYESSMETKVLVQMMLLRCKKPCLINCIIFPMSMENFTWLIKTMFSYFTVIKSCRY